MPKLFNPSDESAFLASVQQGINKAFFKAKQNRKDFEAISNPDYWKIQRQKMQTGKSWDILTEYISF